MDIDPTSKGDLQRVARDLFNPRVSTRTALERSWYRNILYYMGEQWIVWSRSQKSFVPKYRKRKNQPTPVDNVIRDHIRSMKAMIMNKDFDITVWPNSNDRDDRNASSLGEELLRDINARDDFINKDVEEDVALWMFITGTGFIRDYASKDKGQVIDIGNDQSIKTGEVVSENVIAFNVFVDETMGYRLRDKRHFGIQCLKSKDWIKDRWPEFNNDAGGDAQMINYQQTLARMVSSVSPLKNAGTELVSTGNVDDEDLSQYREIEFAPTKKFPKGRYVVMVGNQILEDQPRLPIKTDKDGLWNYSLEDFRAIPVPGRFWGDSTINDLISPQNAINKIDQALEKNRKGLGRTTVISPTGVRLKKKSSADAAVLQLTYDPAKAKGIVPTMHNGIPLPNQVLDERSLQKEVVQDTSGDPKGVLRGKAPSGASGVMVDILRETAEQGHSPDVNRYFRALQRSYRKRLILAQDLYTEERMLKVSGSDGRVSVKHFIGADLRGNTDVRLELTSGMSTTNAGRVQVMKDLTMAGIFNEQIIPPDIREELLKKMKISGFKNKMAADAKRAEEENSQAANGEADFFIEMQLVDEEGNPLPLMYKDPDTGLDRVAVNEQSGEPEYILDPQTGEPPWIPVTKDIVFDVDDHNVHAEIHRRFIISPEFRELVEGVQVTFMSHYEAHMRQIANQMRLEMEAESMAMEKEAMLKHGPQEQPEEQPQRGIPQ